MTDGQRLFEIYRRAWGRTGGNVEPAPWEHIAPEYRPMWEGIAEQFIEARVASMVNRFLGWKLPANFGPDAGISFKPYLPQQTPESPFWPVGTNLFTADQAKAMFEYALGSATLPSAQSPARQDAVEEPVAWMWQHGETGRTGFVDAWQVENGWQEANPSCQLIGPLVFASAGAAALPEPAQPEGRELPPLPQAVLDFDQFLNEPPDFEDQRKVREYRHMAYPRWQKALDAMREYARAAIASLAKEPK